MRRLLGSGTPRELTNAFEKAAEAARKGSKAALERLESMLDHIGAPQWLRVAMDRCLRAFRRAMTASAHQPVFSPGC